MSIIWSPEVTERIPKSLYVKNMRWYKRYSSSSFGLVMLEVAVTRLPVLMGVIPSRLEYCLVNPEFIEIEVSTPECGRIEKSDIASVRDIYSLILGLYNLEYHGIIHGDIKPGNVVKTYYGYALIDYSIMTTKGDHITPTQCYKNELGKYHENGSINRINPIKTALFALGITINHLTKGICCREVAERAISDDKISSFAELLNMPIFAEKLSSPISSDLPYRKFSRIGKNRLKELYRYCLDNNFGLYELAFYITFHLRGWKDIGNKLFFDQCAYMNENFVDFLRGDIDWLNYRIMCSNKQLTLGFLSLIEDGRWIVKCSEDWGNECIPNSLINTKINKILVSTENFDLIHNKK